MLALWGLNRPPVAAAPSFGADQLSTGSADREAPGSGSGGGLPVADGDRDGDRDRDRDRAASRSSRLVVEQPDTRSAALPQVPLAGPAPVRLRIPGVDLDVPLSPVGVAKDGQMEIPEDADRAGWYRHGPRPGDDAGSAVIAGHVDDLNGPGAFLSLTDVVEGDDALVELTDGTTLHYVITDRQTVDKRELDLSTLFDRDGDPVLRMVTCTGPWSDRLGHYTDNLVLTAEPVEP